MAAANSGSVGRGNDFDSAEQCDIMEERTPRQVIQSWFDHHERQKWKAEQLQIAAKLAREGKREEALKIKSSVDSSPVVFDGATLRPAVEAILEENEKLQDLDIYVRSALFALRLGGAEQAEAILLEALE